MAKNFSGPQGANYTGGPIKGGGMVLDPNDGVSGRNLIRVLIRVSVIRIDTQYVHPFGVSCHP